MLIQGKKLEILLDVEKNVLHLLLIYSLFINKIDLSIKITKIPVKFEE